MAHPELARSARSLFTPVVGLLLACAAAPAIPIAAAAADAPTPVVLATGFIPNVQFAPYYLAQDRGYYADAGLDVTIQNGVNANALTQLGAGGIDFAITGGDALVPARVAGVPVVYVMGQFQKYPVGAMAIEGNGPPLSSPADLRGRNIGVSGPNGSTYIAMRALLQAGGLTEDDVHVIGIGFTELEALNQKRIDLAMTFLTNEPVQARAMGLQVETLEGCATLWPIRMRHSPPASSGCLRSPEPTRSASSAMCSRRPSRSSSRRWDIRSAGQTRQAGRRLRIC